MITITNIANVDYDKYDEVWAIVRSLKYTNPKLHHVPELSPSWNLFRTYLNLRDKGKWNEKTFHDIYVPQFLKEMRGKVQQKLLNELVNTKKRICLVCFCTIEELCHRCIVGGMLQGAGVEVIGLSKNYGYYFDWWKNGVPGIPGSEPKKQEHITDHNTNVKYLYRPNQRPLFDEERKTLCFTGRRPKDLCGYNAKKYNVFVNDLTKLIYEEFYVKRGIRRFITGGAQGFDQMAFWAIIKMKRMYGLTDMHNVVFAPFEGQETRWAEEGCFSQTEYWKMIEKADEIIIVSDVDGVGSLFERNHAMCDHSDMCLGLHADSSWMVAGGGTAECMKYAQTHCEYAYRLSYEINASGLQMEEMIFIGHKKSSQGQV